jgi:hypothetical protein
MKTDSPCDPLMSLKPPNSITTKLVAILIDFIDKETKEANENPLKHSIKEIITYTISLKAIYTKYDIKTHQFVNTCSKESKILIQKCKLLINKIIFRDFDIIYDALSNKYKDEECYCWFEFWLEIYDKLLILNRYPAKKIDCAFKKITLIVLESCISFVVDNVKDLEMKGELIKFLIAPAVPNIFKGNATLFAICHLVKLLKDRRLLNTEQETLPKISLFNVLPNIATTTEIEQSYTNIQKKDQLLVILIETVSTIRNTIDSSLPEHTMKRASSVLGFHSQPKLDIKLNLSFKSIIENGILKLIDHQLIVDSISSFKNTLPKEWNGLLPFLIDIKCMLDGVKPKRIISKEFIVDKLRNSSLTKVRLDPINPNQIESTSSLPPVNPRSNCKT